MDRSRAITVDHETVTFSLTGPGRGTFLDRKRTAGKEQNRNRKMTYSAHTGLLTVAAVAAKAGVTIDPRILREMAASNGWQSPTFEQCLDIIDSLFTTTD